MKALIFGGSLNKSCNNGKGLKINGKLTELKVGDCIRFDRTDGKYDLFRGKRKISFCYEEKLGILGYKILQDKENGHVPLMIAKTLGYIYGLTTDYFCLHTSGLRERFLTFKYVPE